MDIRINGSFVGHAVVARPGEEIRVDFAPVAGQEEYIRLIVAAHAPGVPVRLEAQGIGPAQSADNLDAMVVIRHWWGPADGEPIGSYGFTARLVTEQPAAAAEPGEGRPEPAAVAPVPVDNSYAARLARLQRDFSRRDGRIVRLPTRAFPPDLRTTWGNMRAAMEGLHVTRPTLRGALLLGHPIRNYIFAWQADWEATVEPAAAEAAPAPAESPAAVAANFESEYPGEVEFIGAAPADWPNAPADTLYAAGYFRMSPVAMMDVLAGTLPGVMPNAADGFPRTATGANDVTIYHFFWGGPVADDHGRIWRTVTAAAEDLRIPVTRLRLLLQTHAVFDSYDGQLRRVAYVRDCEVGGTFADTGAHAGRWNSPMRAAMELGEPYETLIRLALRHAVVFMPGGRDIHLHFRPPMDAVGANTAGAMPSTLSEGVEALRQRRAGWTRGSRGPDDTGADDLLAARAAARQHSRAEPTRARVPGADADHIRQPNAHGVAVESSGRAGYLRVVKAGTECGIIQICGNGFYSRIKTAAGDVDKFNREYDPLCTWAMGQAHRATDRPREVPVDDAETGPQPERIRQPGNTVATFDHRGRLRIGRRPLNDESD